MKDKVFREFLERVGRDRKFETWERAQWVGKINAAAEFEASSQGKGIRTLMHFMIQAAGVEGLFQSLLALSFTEGLSKSFGENK